MRKNADQQSNFSNKSTVRVLSILFVRGYFRSAFYPRASAAESFRRQDAKTENATFSKLKVAQSVSYLTARALKPKLSSPSF